MTTCYIDLEIGDQKSHQQQTEAYDRASEYYNTVKNQYGWIESSVDQLDQETREIFLEAYAADPNFSSKGPAQCNPSDALTKGRLEIQLDTKAAPKACENFRCLCTGEKGTGKSSGKKLHYIGCRLHRIVKGFCAQGGDVVKNDGSGGDSIYNGTFKDEKGGLALKHDGIGVVAFANSGQHTNRSQFYFTLAAAPQCDGKHVVIGKVVNEEGLKLLQVIDEVAASDSGKPLSDVIIANCGQL